MNHARSRRIRANILLLFGVAWVSYFAFFKPTALNPYWVTIIGLSWFGPGFLTLLRSVSERDINDTED